MRVQGTGGRTDGAIEGDAFWFRGPNNHVTNNIAVNIGAASTGPFTYGFNYFSYFLGTVTIPAFQGADKSVAGQSASINANDTPILENVGNETYGATSGGLTLWWIGTFGDSFYPDARPSVIKNFTAWHFSQLGVFQYPTHNVTFDGLVFRGDTSRLASANPVSELLLTGFLFGDYMNRDDVITNADIQGYENGIVVGSDFGRVPAAGMLTIQNSYLANTINIAVHMAASVNGVTTADGMLSPINVNINNIRFAHPSQSVAADLYDVDMKYPGDAASNPTTYIVPVRVFVYNYNGVAGDNFQVYFTQQQANYILPHTSSTPTPGGNVGSPVSGLTNQQNWNTYGIAVAGAVAPSSATTMPLINGLVYAISATPYSLEITQPVANQTVALSFGVSVQVVDQEGNVVTSDNTDQITLFLTNASTGSVATYMASVVNGVATFSNLRITTALNTYFLSAITPVYFGALSNMFS
jgi:hypothetical protein